MHQASNWEVGEYIRQLTTAISLIFWKVRWPSSLTCCNIQDTLLHHSEFFHLVNQIFAKGFKTFIGKKHQHWFLAFDHLDEFYFSGFVVIIDLWKIIDQTLSQKERLIVCKQNKLTPWRVIYKKIVRCSCFKVYRFPLLNTNKYMSFITFCKLFEILRLFLISFSFLFCLHFFSKVLSDISKILEIIFNVIIMKPKIIAVDNH